MDNKTNEEITVEAPVEAPVENPEDILHLGRILSAWLISSSRYVAESKIWRRYDEGVWQRDPDDVFTAKLVTEEMRRLMAKLLKQTNTKTEQEAIRKFFKPLWKPEKVKQVMRACAINTRRNLIASTNDFDSDPMVLNCLNGTIDLRTGKLVEHNHLQLLTKIVAVKFDPKATCPSWKKFISDIMGGDDDKIAYLSRVLGYAITGLTAEHCFFILHGFGSNGKSTLLEFLRELLSDYVGNLPTESLLLNFRTIRSDLVRLQGQRIVTTSELKEQTRSIDEALIKQLTSGDRTTARESGKNEVDFTPQLKLFVATNHLPTIRGIDDGIWRRVRLILFGASFIGAECDKNIMDKFRPEASGILNWLVEGCLEWQKQGLNEPAIIKKEIVKFREDSNPVKLFLEDCCDEAPGKRIQIQDLYLEYEKWCKENCYVAEGVIPFGKRMIALKYDKGKTGSVRYWKNITFKVVATQSAGVNVGVDSQSDPAQLSPELPDPDKLQHIENISENNLLTIN